VRREASRRSATGPARPTAPAPAICRLRQWAAPSTATTRAHRRRRRQSAGGGDIGRHDREGLGVAPLRRRNSLTARSLRASHMKLIAANALQRTMRRREGARRCRRWSRRARPHSRTGDRLRVKTPARGIAIVARARGRTSGTRPSRFAPIIGQAPRQRVTRSAMRAIDEA